MNAIKERILQLHNLDYTPVDIEREILRTLRDGLRELIEREYITIVFDSPVGADSEPRLTAKGYIAKWYVPQGCRGLTYVYIPKSKKDFNTEKFEELLDELDLLDGGTHIIVK